MKIAVLSLAFMSVLFILGFWASGTWAVLLRPVRYRRVIRRLHRTACDSMARASLSTRTVTESRGY